MANSDLLRKQFNCQRECKCEGACRHGGEFRKMGENRWDRQLAPRSWTRCSVARATMLGGETVGPLRRRKALNVFDPDSSPQAHHPTDPRDSQTLIEAALGVQDEDERWELVCVLHWRGTLEVLTKAKELCRSQLSEERRLGADLLGQLGVPERTFPEECLQILLGMVEDEPDADVLQAILVALGHLGDVRAVEAVLPLSNHPDSLVRHAAVFALIGHEDERAVAALMDLSRDTDAEVRDWATFGLGTQIEQDTPPLREALVARLTDEDEVVRAEAMVGLARRGDRRALEAIARDLAADEVDCRVVEAALLIADPTLHPKLIALRERCVDARDVLDEAIRACTPRS